MRGEQEEREIERDERGKERWGESIEMECE